MPIPDQVSLAVHVIQMAVDAAKQGSLFSGSAREGYEKAWAVVIAYLNSPPEKLVTEEREQVKYAPRQVVPKGMWPDGGPKLPCGCPVGKCVGHAHGINGQPVIVPPQGDKAESG